jgi:F420-non-reducing hydrogenase small subunit
MADSGNKLRLGFFWAAGCGGCEIAFLEIHEKILDLAAAVEIVFWPCIMDTKYHDVRGMPDAHIDICFVNGGIRTEENLSLAELLRKKSKILVAYGACSTMGGIPGLANLYSREAIVERVYRTTESTNNPGGIVPGHHTVLREGVEIDLPRLYPQLRALHQVVDVDYFMPGCPPSAEQTWSVCQAILDGSLPPAGSVIGAGDKSVCDECPCEKRNLKVAAFHRPHEIVPDGRHCLLEQGLICLGPATRSGCGAQCMQAAMPCRGCYGPAGDAEDQGAKMISVLGSILEPENEEELNRAIDRIADPAGTFYRFGLPASILGRARG